LQEKRGSCHQRQLFGRFLEPALGPAPAGRINALMLWPFREHAISIASRLSLVSSFFALITQKADVL
jgi:hypothetical protein